MTILDDLKDTLRLPVIGAPMFIVSTPDSVIAQCKAGIVGSMPALNARSTDMLDEWITQIKDALDVDDAPYAINQICHHSNTRLHDDLAVCVKHAVPIIITSLRPPEDVISAVHAYGGVVMHDVISIRHAEKALEQGVDGLIAVAGGAGGHAGTLNPLALIGEIREMFGGPLALSGSISDGRAILAAQAMGADFAYMGTRFIAAREANAPQAYKQMIIDSAAKDIVYTAALSGVHGSFLAPSITAAGLDLTALGKAADASVNLNNAGNEEELKVWRDIWSAGHGVGLIHDAPSTAEIVSQLEGEYRAARDTLLTR